VIAELIGLKGLWSTLFMACLVFGFAPGAILRIAVMMFPGDDPRRKELLAELYAVPRWERPVWVAEQLEVTSFEGIAERRRRRRQCFQQQNDAAVSDNSTLPEPAQVVVDRSQFDCESESADFLDFMIKMAG
jgi:hypothetical protein